MSNKPSIPAWQRASTDNVASSPPEHKVKSAQQQPVEAPTPTEDDIESEDGGVQLSESSDLLEQASRFLEDPAIRDAPREKKVAFLESKGVSPEDVETLLGDGKEVGPGEQSIVEQSPVEERLVESEHVEEQVEEQAWPSVSAEPPRRKITIHTNILSLLPEPPAYPNVNRSHAKYHQLSHTQSSLPAQRRHHHS